MVEDYRFWLALVLYFSGSTLSSSILSLMRKKRFIPGLIFLVLMLICSVGLWMSLNGGFNDFIILTRTNGVVLLLGILCGLIPFTFPLLIILPLIISFSLKIPLKNLQVQDHRILGELLFYPSNEGSVSLEWIAEDGQDHIVRLQGEKAALVFVKRDVIKEYFF